MVHFWRTYKKIIIIISACGLMGVAWYLISAEGPFLLEDALLSLFWATMLFFILWRGNVLISKRLDNSYPWLHHPIKRFVYGIVWAVLFTTTVLLLLGFGIYLVFDIPMDSKQIAPLYFANAAAVLMFCFFVAWQFLHAWRELALREEKMKNEVLTAKYESLKNQVNPHFLFNSLNSLSSLINENTKLADQFVKQLSNVYRYILETRTREAVTVAEELLILESFIFLERIRYEKNLKIDVNISEEARKKMILPLVLQILLENAIKHNTISNEKPLNIRLYSEGEYIVAENDLQPKSILRNESAKVGLDNIKSRYSILSNQDLIIEKGESSFTVKIPLLTLKEK